MLLFTGRDALALVAHNPVASPATLVAAVAADALASCCACTSASQAIVSYPDVLIAPKRWGGA